MTINAFVYVVGKPSWHVMMPVVDGCVCYKCGDKIVRVILDTVEVCLSPLTPGHVWDGPEVPDRANVKLGGVN